MNLCFLALLFNVSLQIALGELLSTASFAVGAGVSIVGTAMYSSFKCRFQECCAEPWVRSPQEVKYQTSDLLAKRLYGQPLVAKVIQAHLSSRKAENSKALVLSFHGPTGTGKSYVRRILSESAYKLGVQSQYILTFKASEFPLASQADRYAEELTSWIHGNATNCQSLIIIFEEVDKLSSSHLLDSMRVFMDSSNHRGTPCHQLSFFLLSNLGSHAITRTYIQLASEGIKRDDMPLKTFSKAIRSEVFNAIDTGLYDSQLIERGFIDAFVPFFPLERQHVRQCIETYLNNLIQSLADRKRFLEIGEQLIDLALEEIEFDEDGFSLKGCRSVEFEVDNLWDSMQAKHRQIE